MDSTNIWQKLVFVCHVVFIGLSFKSMVSHLFTRKLISTLLPLTLVLGIFLSINNNSVEKVDASSYTLATIPTTIDLNDSTASEIRNYYSSLNSLTTSQRQGTNLLKNLKPILKNGQKYLSYGSGATTAVWQAYEIVDRDWAKSPASSISGYNSSTNKITNYTYGTSNSNVGSNPYIHALYVNRNVTNQTQAWGNHNQDQWGINQEHIWAKSCGFNDNSPAIGARGDIMHLWAGNGKVNGTYHSNYYYGYVDTTKSYTDASSYASTLSGNRKGYSKSLGGSNTVFEPQDSDKGDIARAIFYMAARYNYLSGSDSDGIDAGNPNLEIVNVLNWGPGSSYQSTTSTKGQMGILQDLLEWNRLDPPDEWEIHRNNLCYKNYTNNRNPFIDFPEWAEFIWGKSTNGSYSSTSTGYATPSSDVINGYGGASSVSVTGVSLNKNSTSLVVGDTESLTATVSPSNATNKSVTWSSSKTSVATVSSSGVVTAKSAGSATITVKTTDGSYKATCSVTVTAAAKTLSSISVSGQKTEYSVGEEFVKPTVTAHFSDSSTSNVTSSATFGGFDSSSVGQQTINISYTYGGVTKSTSYTISVVSEEVEETSSGSANYTEITNSWVKDGTDTYSTGEIKFDGSNDYILKNDIFNAFIASKMISLTVTINGKWNSGTSGDGSTNEYTVDAIGSENQILNTITKTGSSIFSNQNYSDVTYTFESNLTGCTGIRLCYSHKGAGNWAVKSISWVATYLVSTDVNPSSIMASTNRVFYVGETITSADITVFDNLGNQITDFDFSPYTFTYEDSPGGGNVTFEDDFEIEYQGMETYVSVMFQRKPFMAQEGDTFSIVSSSVFSSIGGSNTSLVSGSVTDNGITYVYDKAYYYGSGNSVSFGNANSIEGYLKNNTSLSNGIYDVSVTSTGRLINIRYSTDGLTWILKNESNINLNDYKYFKLDCAGNTGSNYSNITRIDVTLKATGAGTPDNIANYIMFEDTNNQCTTKFDVAKGYFESLTKAQRNTFMTSNDYVISAARTRLEAWARSLGKTIYQSNGDYVISNLQFNVLDLRGYSGIDYPVIIMISILTFGTICIVVYYFVRRRKNEK